MVHHAGWFTRQILIATDNIKGALRLHVPKQRPTKARKRKRTNKSTPGDNPDAPPRYLRLLRRNWSFLFGDCMRKRIQSAPKGDPSGAMCHKNSS